MSYSLIIINPPQTLFVVGYTVFTLCARASFRASVRPKHFVSLIS